MTHGEQSSMHRIDGLLQQAAGALPMEEVQASGRHLDEGKRLLAEVAAKSGNADLPSVRTALDEAAEAHNKVAEGLETTAQALATYAGEVGLTGAEVQTGTSPEPRTRNGDGKGNSKKLWEQFGAVHAQLRTASETIANKVVANIEQTLNTQSDRAVENTGHVPIFTKLPSDSDEYIMVPPHAFGNLDDPDWKVRIPQDDAELEQMKREYVRNRDHHWFVNENVWYWSDSGKESELNIFDVLAYIRDNNFTLEAEVWEQYRQAVLAQVRDTRTYRLDSLTNFRYKSVKSFRHFQEQLSDDVDMQRTQFSSATIHIPAGRHESLQGGSTPADYIVLPVGAYGEEWTDRLIRTAVFAQDQVVPVTHDPDVKAVAEANEEVLRKHTARGKRTPPEVPASEVLGYIAEEGISSSIQVLSLMTAEKVEGYDDPIDLARDIIEAGLIEEFTRAVPTGVTAPMALGGMYIPNLIQKVDGKLRLNPTVMEHVRRAKDRQVAMVAAGWEAHAADPVNEPGEVLGLICPAAMPKGALQKLNHILFKSLTAIR